MLNLLLGVRIPSTTAKEKLNFELWPCWPSVDHWYIHAIYCFATDTPIFQRRYFLPYSHIGVLWGKTYSHIGVLWGKMLQTMSRGVISVRGTLQFLVCHLKSSIRSRALGRSHYGDGYSWSLARCNHTKKVILIATDYFSKWVEAEVLEKHRLPIWDPSSNYSR